MGPFVSRVVGGAVACLLGLVVVAALLVVRPDTAAACSCAVDPSAAAAFERADVAFVGELVRIDPPLLATSSAATQQLRFEVTRVYKGEVSAGRRCTPLSRRRRRRV